MITEKTHDALLKMTENIGHFNHVFFSHFIIERILSTPRHFGLFVHLPDEWYEQVLANVICGFNRYDCLDCVKSPTPVSTIITMDNGLVNSSIILSCSSGTTVWSDTAGWISVMDNGQVFINIED